MTVEYFKATSEIRDKQGKFIGFSLLCSDGTTANIKSEAVEAAIKAGKACIENLEERDGRLRLKVSEEQKRLTEELKLANRAYETSEQEQMSNHEYDIKLDRLAKLEKESGVVLDGSPTVNVGADVSDSKLAKYTFKTPMKSLAKTKSVEELLDFLGGRQAIISTKMDGLTVVLEYNNGLLERAITRGNGAVGEIVTENAKTFVNVPTKIEYTGKLVLRGEAVMKYSDFERINATSGGKYKNPRNLCSGSVRQLDANITKSRNIFWYCFDLVECDINNDDYEKQLELVTKLGFECAERITCDSSSLVAGIQTMTERAKASDIPADGLVVRYKDNKYGMSLGSIAKSPKHSLAFKWEDEEVTTELTGITWQVGRSGVITPVAEFKPVDIEGSTVKRATLHNISVMAELLGVPHVGQRIGVYKANMIIPNVAWGEIKQNVSDDIALTIPKRCPCCGSQTFLRKDNVSGVLTLWCDNDNCSAKGNKLLEHFVSRDAMNIEGLSSARLSDFAEAGLVDDFCSIFELEYCGEVITSLPGYGEKSFNNLVESLEKAKKVKLSNLIYALGIPNIGLETSKTICKYFDFDVNRLLSADYYDLCSIPSIGDVIAESFVSYFEDEINAEQFKRLLKIVTLVTEQKSNDTSMSGLTFCVTGDVYIFKNRRAVKEEIERRGGKLTGSVSRSTDYLITNDDSTGSNKCKAAMAYGTPILTEEQFIEKFDIEV